MNTSTSTHSQYTATATLFPTEIAENLSTPLRLPHVSELGFWFEYVSNKGVRALGIVRNDHQRHGYSLVWQFKNRHTQAILRVADMVADELLDRYGRDTLADMVFCAIPAHNEATTRARLDPFTERVCRRTGMTDGTRHVHVMGNAPAKHTTGVYARRSAYRVDTHVFGHKDVILFDDVKTTGKTAATFAQFVEQYGGNVLGAYFLAKTIIL